MRSEIEARLKAMVGQPLTASHRAADMEMFSFGEAVVPGQDRTGNAFLRSRYGLHVQCPWRIVASGSLIVGYRDLGEPNSEVGDDPAFDPNELGKTLREERLDAFFLERRDEPRVVTALTASELGDLRVTLDQDCTLEVFPDGAATDREHWRFIDLLGGDFVVSGGAAEFLP